MSKKKKGSEKCLANILLATAMIQLIQAVFSLLETLLE